MTLPEEESLRPIAGSLRQRLRRRVPARGHLDLDPAFDLLVEGPRQEAADNPLWRFWLWLIDERPGGPRGPSGGRLWRLGAYSPAGFSEMLTVLPSSHVL